MFLTFNIVLILPAVGPSPGGNVQKEPQKEKKPTVFDRLGDSKVSSTVDASKSRASPSSSSGQISTSSESSKDSSRNTVRQ